MDLSPAVITVRNLQVFAYWLTGRTGHGFTMKYLFICLQFMALTVTNLTPTFRMTVKKE